MTVSDKRPEYSSCCPVDTAFVAAQNSFLKDDSFSARKPSTKWVDSALAKYESRDISGTEYEIPSSKETISNKEREI